TVLSHFPTANSEVKKNRKIYLTVNPTNFRKVEIPNIIQITKRSAISSLLSTDLEIGEILYENNIGKDMVIQILFNDDEVEPGLLVPKKSRIDLVLGNGIAPNDE
ncbi:MAG: penicillin-binding protein, partial [Flavobacteriaceae bacterium]|nr:penicillin-binding protein [Flavobacteriaceae bacterium]